MSKVGKKPISINSKIKFAKEGAQVTLAGPKGELSFSLPTSIEVGQEGSELIVRRKGNSPAERALHGTWRAILQNAVIGLTKGYQKELQLVGLGYRATAQGKTLTLRVGYSHPVELEIPEEIDLSIEKTTITLKGTDKEKVGGFAAKIRQVRPPEPYKGTGIRYVDEVIRKKPGKAAKALGTGPAA